MAVARGIASGIRSCHEIAGSVRWWYACAGGSLKPAGMFSLSKAAQPATPAVAAAAAQSGEQAAPKDPRSALKKLVKVRTRARAKTFERAATQRATAVAGCHRVSGPATAKSGA